MIALYRPLRVHDMLGLFADYLKALDLFSGLLVSASKGDLPALAGLLSG